MADREVANQDLDIKDIPELLQQILKYAIVEGREMMQNGQDVVPFTTLVVKDNAILEQHPGDNPAQCYASAEHNVKGARGATGYAFCYDGYIETEEGTKDALISEGGLAGENEGFAIGQIYELDKEESPIFEERMILIGNAPNFMKDLKPEDGPDNASLKNMDEDAEEFESVPLEPDELVSEQDPNE